MNERATRQSDEQTASQTNGKWTNSTNKRLQTRELNKWLNTPISFQNKQKQCHNVEKYFWAALNKFSRN